MRGLKDKRVLITGGASGIGAATAARFLEEGSRVCVLDRNAQACEHIKHELPALGEAIIADVTGTASPQAGGAGGRSAAKRGGGASSRSRSGGGGALSGDAGGQSFATRSHVSAHRVGPCNL